VPEQQLSEDPRAQVQAWILGYDVERLGLRLRLRYEYLQPEADDDPDPWEPDVDDLHAIEDNLRAAVAGMGEEDEWKGENDPQTCGRCRYRSICRDSAARGEPSWPVLSSEEPDADQ